MLDALYTDRWQCLDFEVDYFDPGSLTIRADELLNSKRGGYDSKHRAFLEPLGQAQLVLSRTGEDTIGPGWWRIRVSQPLPLQAIETQLDMALYLSDMPELGLHTAKRIVAKFGQQTRTILEHEPERLLEVKGIAQKRMEAIRSRWEKVLAEKPEGSQLAEVGEEN